jgi:hypothetical protein
MMASLPVASRADPMPAGLDLVFKCSPKPAAGPDSSRIP